MRRDGSEFPIELTITRIGEADPPMFTGFMRDITGQQGVRGGARAAARARARRPRWTPTSRAGSWPRSSAAWPTRSRRRRPTASCCSRTTPRSRRWASSPSRSCWRRPSRRSAERFEPLDEDGEPFPTERLPGRIALQEGRSAEDVIRFRDPRDGGERWSRVKSTPVLGEDGEVAMAINVIEDVTELKRAEEAQRLLAEAGRLLASSLDTEAILQRIAALATSPWLADWCSLHVVDARGQPADGGVGRVRRRTRARAPGDRGALPAGPPRTDRACPT